MIEPWLDVLAMPIRLRVEAVTITSETAVSGWAVAGLAAGCVWASAASAHRLSAEPASSPQG